MKNRYTFCMLLICCLAVAQLQAQIPNFSWARDVGSMGTSANYLVKAHKIVLDKQSNVYSLSSVNNQHLRLSKYSRAGVLLWQKTLTEGTGNVVANDIAIDQSGNLCIVGNFQDMVDFNGGDSVYTLSSNGGNDIFIQKVDSIGKLIWAKSMGGNNHDRGSSVNIDRNGNIYFTGQFSDTVDFDPSDSVYVLSSPTVHPNMFVCALDTRGSFIWANTVNTRNIADGISIFVDTKHVYVTGYFATTSSNRNIDFDPSADGVHLIMGKSGNIYTPYDAFIQKLDTNGNFVWARSVGGASSTTFGYSVFVDAMGSVYNCGVFSSIVEFDGSDTVYTASTNGGQDIYIQKIDSAGNIVWMRTLGGSGNESVFSIYGDAKGDIYLIGSFENTVDFDPGDGVYNLSSNGSNDVFLKKLDTDGNFVWARSMEGSGDDKGHKTVGSSDCGVYASGVFQGRLDIDPDTGTSDTAYIGVSGDANYHAFVLQLEQDYTDYTPDTTVVSVCDGYMWRGKTYRSSGVYRDTICGDVLVAVLNLTIQGERWDSVLQVEICDSYAWRGGFYTSSALYVDSLTRVNGCDSVYRLDLTIKGQSDATTDTVEACDSYVWHGNTFRSTGIRTKIEMNIQGCDSLLHLDLTIQHSSPEARDTAIHCASVVWRDSTYTSTGVYWDSLVNRVGCDSILALDLSIIDTVDTVVIQENSRLVARLENGVYQWLDCENSYMAIAGATNRIFTATTNGQYAVDITDVCIDTSSCHTITGLSIDALEMQGPLGIHIYPSPTQGKVFIELGQFSKRVFVVVRDVFGRVLQDQQYANVKRINTRLETSAGMYYIEVSDDKGNRGVFRVVKQ